MEPHPPNTRAWRAVERGATWGTLAGLIIAQIYIRANSIDTPFGPIYGGNMFLAFAIPSGIGAALGAALGWLSVQQTSDERALYGEPDPDGDDEPIELGSDELAPAGTAGIFFTENGRAIFLTADGS